MRRTSRLFVITMLFALLISACSTAAAPAAPANQSGQPTAAPALSAGSITLNGAGATFPDPIYTEWRFAYQYVDPSVTINYQAIGSGGGKKAIVDGTVDFAGSDSLLTTEYTATTKGQLQMFPTLAGAIVPIFNVKDYTGTLVLDGPTLVGIYSGKIKNWNDPAIAKLNPDAKLPDA